jgi:phage terminase small subunit
VDEYLVDLNATQAAIRAGYAPKTAYSQGQRLLKNVEVEAAVRAGVEARGQRTEITQDRVLEELTILAHSCVDDYAVSPQGRLVPAEGRPPEVMRAVSSVKYKTRTVGRGEDAQTFHEVEFRLWDKPNTLKLEGRHTGLFPNEVKVDVGEGTLADILKMAHQINAGQPG